jgi:hypothetical protein
MLIRKGKAGNKMNKAIEILGNNQSEDSARFEEELIYEDSTDFDTWGFVTYPTREEALQASKNAHPAGKRQKIEEMVGKAQVIAIRSGVEIRDRMSTLLKDERGDVPGWVLVVLMTTGLVTAIWAIAKPNLTNILNNSLNSMNSVK